MVLEKIYRKFGPRTSVLYFFLMGAIYAIVAIAIARAIFPTNIGLVAVFLISLALCPTVNNMLSINAILYGREKELTTKGVFIKMSQLETRGSGIGLKDVYLNNRDIIKAYAFSFLGIFAVFSAVTLYLPNEQVNVLFGEQFNILLGKAFAFDTDFFTGILLNNLGVLLVCFLISLIYEYGTTFVVTWNASVWGIAFALQAKNLSLGASIDPAIFYGGIMLCVLPHMIAEASSYFTAAIAGGITSKAFATEQFGSERFMQLLQQSAVVLVVALVIVVLAGGLETTVPGLCKGLVFK